MLFLVTWGYFTVDTLSNLQAVLWTGFKDIYKIAYGEYQFQENRRLYLALSPGDQYRSHIKAGGFRQ